MRRQSPRIPLFRLYNLGLTLALSVPVMQSRPSIRQRHDNLVFHQFPCHVAPPSALSIGVLCALRITPSCRLEPHSLWRSPTKANSPADNHVQWECGRQQALQARIVIRLSDGTKDLKRACPANKRLPPRLFRPRHSLGNASYQLI